MTLLWFEGFEGYTDNADIDAVPFLNGNGLVPSNSYGRRGSRGIQQDHYNDYYSVNLSDTNYFPAATNNTTIIVGFALYLTNTPPAYLIWKVLATLAPHIHLYFKSSSDLLEVRGYDVYDILGTGTISLGIGGWNYVEIKVYVHDTAGTVDVLVNGDSDISVSGIDTKRHAYNYFSGVDIRSGNCVSVRQDDLYVCNGQGSKNNNFLGDIRVDPLRPDGAGTYTQLTPSAGSNYQNVDESPGPDDNTTYNESGTVGHKDLYAMGNLPSPAGTTIHGVKSQITVRKTDAGARKCKLLTRVATTEDLANEITLVDAFTTHPKVYENNPHDSAAFEDSDVNGIETGVQITV